MIKKSWYFFENSTISEISVIKLTSIQGNHNYRNGKYVILITL